MHLLVFYQMLKKVNWENYLNKQYHYYIDRPIDQILKWQDYLIVLILQNRV